ncbi:MAG: hypothetical protein EBQ95_07860 [Gammaproteobacteria bacterium]|nr:hypothetical protein [Gammaproteobacteria bacterium]
MKTPKKHLYTLIISLMIIGMSIFAYRYLIMGVPLKDNEMVNTWTLEANLRFQADKNHPIKASFSIPYLPPQYTILDEYFIAQNYGISTHLNNLNRQVVWTLRRGVGPQSLYYRAILKENENAVAHKAFKPPIFRKIQLDEPELSAAQSIINNARQSSADIQTFAEATIRELRKNDGNARLFIGNNISNQTIVSSAMTILNQANIYATAVHGIRSKQQNHADLETWLAVYNQKEWTYINPKNGAPGLPNDFIIWHYGDEPLFTLFGGQKAVFNLNVTPTPMNALNVAKTHGLQSESELMRFSLLQLPLATQATYKILLTVPVGAFIILLLRNFIGLQTFGTFMPVLIALAFRETHVVWGICLFNIIIFFGLMARFYLDQLRLLLVPRLSAILTIVILLMIGISILSQNLSLESGLSIALFPMVILTMTIERMCIMWDERSPYAAIKASFGSLFAATLCYWAMTQTQIQYLVFAFPELILVILGFILWFGQYRGYRLLELVRFNSLARLAN